jgi:hypothetical protein
MDKSTDGGLLWRVSGNGLKAPSYLLGTHHAMSGDFLDSIPCFFDVLDSVKLLAVESDFTKPKDLDSLKQQNKFLPTDTTYLDLLDRKELAILDSILLAYSTVNSEKMNLNPNFLLVNLQLGILFKESREWAKENPYLRAVNFRRCIDSRALKIAKFRSYPIIELDSEEELNRLGLMDWSILFSSNDLHVRAKEMVQSFKDIQADSLVGIAKEMMTAYYNQDLQLINRWSTHPKSLKDEKAKAIYYTITIERNLLWMDKIVSTIEQQPSLVAVGVAHLPGEEGIINLLKKEGFTVEPVKSE